MSVKIYHRHTCRLCNSSKLQIALPLTLTPLEDDFLPKNKADPLRQCYPLEVVCEQCGHAQLSQVISAESIYDHYIYQKNTSSVTTVEKSGVFIEVYPTPKLVTFEHQSILT